MKAIRIILSVLAIAAGAGVASADEEVTVVLKNGTELTGYMARQVPGGSLTFTTSKAVVNVPGKDVTSITDHKEKESKLSQEWKEWADSHDAWQGEGDKRELTLNSVTTTKGSVNNVKVLQRGSTVKYVELSPNTYVFNRDSIEVLKVAKRPKLMLSGLDIRCDLKNGDKFEGQYVEEVPGKTISLLNENGVVEVIDVKDIYKKTQQKVNPNQTYFEQTPVVDIVELKNHTQYRGLIVETDYATKQNPVNYIVIETEEGNRINVNMADVLEYRKEKNSKYNPMTDIVLKPEEGAVNREITKFVPLKEVSGALVIENDSLQLKLKKNKPMVITVEVPMTNVNANQLKLMKLQTYKAKKTGEEMKGFSYEDIVKSAVLPKKEAETSVNGISRLEFALPEGSVGLYGLYDNNSGKILLFSIE